jgi:hypothetical protein
MPLESRLTRKPVSVAAAAEAAGGEAISPRRRGLSTAEAAAEAAVPPREDDLDREAAIDAAVDSFVGADPGIEVGGTRHGGEPPADTGTPAEEEEDAPPQHLDHEGHGLGSAGSRLASAPVIPKKTRQARTKVAKPEGSEGDLRDQLKLLEQQLRSLKQDYQTNAAPLIARYKEVSAALADSLLG